MKAFARLVETTFTRPSVGQGFYFKKRTSKQKSISMEEYQLMTSPLNIAVSRKNQDEKISYTKHPNYGRIPQKITTISEDGLTKIEKNFIF